MVSTVRCWGYYIKNKLETKEEKSAVDCLFDADQPRADRMDSEVDGLVLDIAEGCSVQIADHVRRHTEDAADFGHLKLSGLQKLGFVVRQTQRNKGHAFFQHSNTAGVGGTSVGSVPAGPECSGVFHRVWMRQDAAGACAVGKELASVLLSGDTQTDSRLFKGNGTVAHDAVKAESGNVEHIPRFKPPAFAVAGCIGVCQKASGIAVNFHLVRQKRIQTVDLVSAGADDLAVGIAVQQQMRQHRFPQDERGHFLVGLIVDQPVQRMFRRFSAYTWNGRLAMVSAMTRTQA